MRILISGAAGFIGRSLAEHFLHQGGHSLLVPEKSGLDFRDSEAVRKFMAVSKPDVVIHAAAVGGNRKTGYDSGSTGVFSDNVRMFLNVTRSLAAGARLINLGSGSEYDYRAYTPKMKETSFGGSVPQDPYGFSKYAISRYVEAMPNAVSLRLFGLFGPYEDYTYKFISNAIVKNLLGMPITINQNVRFDYLYIKDFCRVMEKFVSGPCSSRHYNVTPSDSITLLELAGLINKVAQKPSEIVVLNPGMNREYSGDNSRLISEFPDLAFTPYQEAVSELYSYYRANLRSLDIEAVKKDPYLKVCRKI